MIVAGEVVRIRVPRRALLPHYVAPAVWYPLGTISAWILLPRAQTDVGRWPQLAWAVLTVLLVAVVTRDVVRPLGVDLRDDVAVVVGPFRSREVAWRDVRAVAFRRGRHVTLYLADGTEVRCPYPAHSWLVPWRRVDADYHRVGQWWLAHRGPDPRPVGVPRAANR